MRLAFRFAGALILVITLVLSINAYVRVRREAALFEGEIVRDAQTTGRVLGPLVVETWRREGEERAKELVSQANTREPVRIRLVFLDGGSSGEAAPLTATQLEHLAREGSLSLTTREQIEGQDHDFMVTYVSLPFGQGPSVALEFAESLDLQHAFIRRTVFTAVVTTVGLSLLCGIASMFLGLYLVGRPVRALVAQARRIGSGNFAVRLTLDQRDEIGELATEVNAMSERLSRAKGDLERATNARLRALAELRHVERVATVGKLASGIAHELGTPLQVISGHAGMIAEDTAAGADARESAAVIREQADRMAAIIRQLLDFARRGTSNRGPADLGEIVDRTARMLGPIAEKSSVSIEVRRPPDGVLALVDVEQIVQVLSNLTMNAIQAMPRGGLATLQLDRTTRPAANGEPGSFARIQVRDTGAGIEPSAIPHVFEPFFTTKEVGSGTGLGLSVAYGIVEDHEGILEVESEPGAGSTFTVLLPVGEDT